MSEVFQKGLTLPSAPPRAGGHYLMIFPATKQNKGFIIMVFLSKGEAKTSRKTRKHKYNQNNCFSQ